MKSVGTAALVGALVAAGSAAPAARADISLYCRPGCWGAIATSQSTGQISLRLNYTAQQRAEDAALMWCDILGQTNDCQVAISGLGCLSIAESSDGKLAGRQAFTQDAADAAALDSAGPGSKIDLNGCSGW
ncbi:DUF4189 domain-containing protein [Mycobacterium shigaense]|uniref:DUF4189 domain-containing protein n=1 Tax=Mycobacterium shigaense TaxID=722731 RepID=A0A1Z4ECR0_9MYCO|nr:DUF4189 domain-containing protein [Mycobacterium shigaense]MEA1122376.1 DUF4189 domain-containing protein [Mycobacterium shigaense]BAX90755.1 hypothetical protein MSG_00591 [Mycobacterium shigaense]